MELPSLLQVPSFFWVTGPRKFCNPPPKPVFKLAFSQDPLQMIEGEDGGSNPNA